MPTEPTDGPTCGQVDPDIQAAVDEWGPKSIELRAVVAGALQDLRDIRRAADPTTQNPPAAADWSWQDDPDVVSWDHRQGPDLTELTEVLARHGVTLTEVDTGTDDVAVRIGSTPVEAMEDALCRRVWAAALRWLSGQVARQADASDWVADLAGQIEAGTLTPWAETAPAAPPSVAVEPPAAPGAGTDTPEAHSGAEGLILGQALLDDDGSLWWWSAEDGCWRSGSSYLSNAPTGAREVLLVRSEIAELVNAAQSWREASKRQGVYAEHVAALAAAVDAATSRQPEPGEEPLADWERELLGLEPEPGLADLTDAERAEALAIAEGREPAVEPPRWDRPGIEDARAALERELASHRESRTTVEQLRYENEALRADLSWHCAAREALAAALLPVHDEGWECTCNCGDKEAHDEDCRMGHRPDCPADCTGPCPGLVDQLRLDLTVANAALAQVAVPTDEAHEAEHQRMEQQFRQDGDG